jgi:hypothetical protein
VSDHFIYTNARIYTGIVPNLTSSGQ